MADRVTPAQRSENMRRIMGSDTAPELAVRRVLHRLGFRFRLHVLTLPGRPDIVLPKYRTVILVHGCFWHQHPGCQRAAVPDANRSFWMAKFSRNRDRDSRVRQALRRAGWRTVIVWECETKPDRSMRLKARLKRCLGVSRN